MRSWQATRTASSASGTQGRKRIFGYAGAEAVGQTWDTIIPERQRVRPWLGYRLVMATAESRYGCGDVLAVPGSARTPISLEFTIAPLRDETGRMAGMAAIMRDVIARFEEMRAMRRRLVRGDQGWGIASAERVE